MSVHEDGCIKPVEQGNLGQAPQVEWYLPDMTKVDAPQLIIDEHEARRFFAKWLRLQVAPKCLEKVNSISRFDLDKDYLSIEIDYPIDQLRRLKTFDANKALEIVKEMIEPNGYDVIEKRRGRNECGIVWEFMWKNPHYQEPQTATRGDINA